MARLNNVCSNRNKWAEIFADAADSDNSLPLAAEIQVTNTENAPGMGR